MFGKNCGVFASVSIASMPMRLGHFYAFLLLLTCLGINVAFFPEVREPFLGGEDPLVSLKQSLSDLNIKARFAEIFPKIQSEPENEPEVPSPSSGVPQVSAKLFESPPKTSKELTQDSTFPSHSAQNELIPVPAPLPSSPEKSVSSENDPKELKPEDFEKKQSEKAEPAEKAATRQTSAVVPKPVSAPVQSVVADQFKPIVPSPKTTAPDKLSSEAVWDTIDTVIERPLRYD